MQVDGRRAIKTDLTLHNHQTFCQRCECFAVSELAKNVRSSMTRSWNSSRNTLVGNQLIWNHAAFASKYTHCAQLRLCFEVKKMMGHMCWCLLICGIHWEVNIRKVWNLVLSLLEIDKYLGQKWIFSDFATKTWSYPCWNRSRFLVETCAELNIDFIFERRVPETCPET